MGMPVTVAMGNAYYVFFMPMVIAMRMRMPTVMGMPMTMCTGTYTIGKHASWCMAVSPLLVLLCFVLFQNVFFFRINFVMLHSRPPSEHLVFVIEFHEKKKL